MANTFSFEDASKPLDDANGDASKPFSFEEAMGAPKPSSLARRALGDTAVSAAKSIVGAGESAVGLADLATGGRAGKALSNLTGYDPKATKAALDDLYSPEQKAANKAVQEAEGFIPTLSALAKNPSAIVQGVVEAAPSAIAAGGAAQALGKAGILAKNALARGALGEGLVGAGQQAEQFRQDNPDGTLSARQEIASLASGAGTAAFAGLGGKAAQKLGIADLDTMLAGGAAPAAAAKQGLARRIGEGFISEGALEEMPQSIWEQGAQNFGNGKALGEGVGNAAATGLVVGGVMGGGTNVTAHQPKAAPAEQAAAPATTPDGTIPYEPTTVADVAKQRAAEMGINPSDGPLSAAASMAVESGAAAIPGFSPEQAQSMQAGEIRDAAQQAIAEGQYQAEQRRAEQEARAAAEPGIPFEPVPPSEYPSANQSQPDPTPNAVWRNKDFDLPVEVLPEAESIGPDGRAYIKVRGTINGQTSESYVPADEVTRSAKPVQATSPGVPIQDWINQQTGVGQSSGVSRKDFEAAAKEKTDPQIILDEQGRPKTTDSRLDIQQFQADRERRESLRARNEAAGQRLRARRQPGMAEAEAGSRIQIAPAVMSEVIRPGDTLQGRNLVDSNGTVIYPDLNIQQYREARQILANSTQEGGGKVAASQPQEAPQNGNARSATDEISQGSPARGGVDARGVVDLRADGRGGTGRPDDRAVPGQAAAGVPGAGAGGAGRVKRRGGVVVTDERLQHHADALASMAQDAGWQEQGGRMIRDGDGNVTGRTKWLPRAEWFQAGMQADPQALAESVRKAQAGEAIPSKDQRTISAMMDYLDAQEQGRPLDENSSAAEWERVGYNEASAQDQALFDDIDNLLDATPLKEVDAMRALGFTEDEIRAEIEASNTQRGNSQAAAGSAQEHAADDRAGARDQDSADLLQAYSEQDLASRAEAERLAAERRAQDDKRAEDKARADSERDTFTLTGSDRPADVLAAQGQEGLFDQPATPSAPDESKAAADRIKARILERLGSKPASEYRGYSDSTVSSWEPVQFTMKRGEWEALRKHSAAASGTKNGTKLTVTVEDVEDKVHDILTVQSVHQTVASMQAMVSRMRTVFDSPANQEAAEKAERQSESRPISVEESTRLVEDLNRLRDSAPEEWAGLRYQHLYRRIMSAERGNADAVSWARGWIKDLDQQQAASEEVAKTDRAASELASKSGREKILSGNVGNPYYQAFLDTVEDPASLIGDDGQVKNHHFLNWIGERRAAYEKEYGNVQGRKPGSPSFGDYLSSYAEAHKSNRLKAGAAPLESLFSDLDSTSTRKANKAKKAAAKLPQADRIEHVQAHFHDLLIQAMDAGNLEVNGMRSLTEETQQCL